MGATPSNTRQKEFVAEIEGWPGFVERMCMTSSDVSGIATAFRKATESSEGKYLQRADFEHWLDMGSKPKPVEERLFEVFIVNSEEQQISLHDFVVGLLNYCTDSKENLSRLAFDVYDRHTTGTITEADLEGMLIDVWGVNWEDDALARGLLAERVGVDPMQPTEWNDFCRSYPNLLHPIYKLQRTLQDMTIGKKRWAKLNEKMKLRAAKMESDHARMMRDALTEEDKQLVIKTIREENAEASMLNGTRSERIVAVKAVADGGDGGLVPGLTVRTGPAGLLGGTSKMAPPVDAATPHSPVDAATKVTELTVEAMVEERITSSLEARNRLNAAKNRANVLGVDATTGDKNTLRRSISGSEQEMPKFAMTSRKVKGSDLAEDGEDGDGLNSLSAMTAGSNGTTRAPLGSPNNSGQRQAPSLSDTMIAGGSAGHDERPSLAGSHRIGGGKGYSGSTIGSPGARSKEASDARRTSRVDRPSSGELGQKRASTAMAVTKRPSTMATTGAGSQRKPSVAITAMSHRPDVTTHTGKHPSIAGVGGRGAGASKRTSAVAYREGRKDLLPSHRKASQQGVGASRRISRAVVAAGS